jgi:hypothetical protein
MIDPSAVSPSQLAPGAPWENLNAQTLERITLIRLPFDSERAFLFVPSAALELAAARGLTASYRNT